MYHVTARGNRGEPIFADDRDRERFLGLVALVVRRYDWTCHAYCLMTTHYHLMITTNEANIGRGMHLLNGRYAQSFNRRHKVSGHVFGDRYHSVIVKRDAHVLDLVRYIALNPVRAGLSEAPEDWHWSSYGYALGLRAAPAFLSCDLILECFGFPPQQARERMRSFVRMDGRFAVPAA
jgi:REP element-mobilizing transposase RayT